MGDNFYLGDRDGVRTPMQWTSDRNAGFSEGNPHRLYLPVILDPEYHYEFVNVEMQGRNTSSLLWWMKRMINKRKQYKAFSRGDMKFISSENPKILAFTRSYEEEIILVVVNLSRYTQPAELDLENLKGYVPVEIFSKNKFPSVKADTPYFLTLGAHDCLWFALEKSQAAKQVTETLPLLEIATWKDLSERNVHEILEREILYPYLSKMRWFGGKSRTVESLQIIKHARIPLQENDALIYLIELSYDSGLPDTYQLPVAFGRGDFSDKISNNCPQAVLCRVNVGGEEGVLYDAIYGLEFQRTIFSKMAANQSISLKHSVIEFYGNKQLKKHFQEHDKVVPRVLSGEQSNSSIIYDNRYFVKFFRKVDKAINPDMEIIQFLTEEAKFKYVPGFVGAVEWKYDNGGMVLALMQDMVESSSDAWTYMLDRLDDFNERILSQQDVKKLPSLKGTITDPVPYEHVPMEVKELLEGPVAERANLLGIRTGEMHLALASNNQLPNFKSEPYSLHYQRSLFAGLQSLVRGTFNNQSRNLKKLSDDIRPEAEEVIGMKDEILKTFKNIYKRKIDVVKIRIHGDYHLGQVLFTGKDFVITDFEGEPARSYSERRLKRSPLRDVAGMIRSFHYAAYGGLFLDNQIRKEDINRLIPYAEQWYHYMSGFFMKSYLETVKGSAFIPKAKEDMNILMTTFLLEKAIYELNYELNNRPDWVIIPLRGIKEIVKNS
jgi:maltose alpha-D-glucosyltransferase/alpha-amylase